MRSKLPFVLAMSAGLALASAARAQLWDGGGTNDNWGTANNWNPNGVPVNDGTANVGFRGTVRLSPVVNGTVDIRSITFVSPAGSFDINSGGFHSFLMIGAGGIVNNDDSGQSISNPIRLTAAQTWRAASGPLDISAADGQGNALTIDGPFSTTLNRYTGSASSLIKSGSGTLFMTGNSTSSGGITVNAGTLSVDADSRLGNNAVVVNGGTLAVTADATMLRNITLTTAGAALNAGLHQLSYDAGVLTVNGGGVTSGSGFLGAGLPANGSAVLNGSSSSWTMIGSFVAGYQDQGTLSVLAGADLSSGISHIGSLPGSTGVATVNGSGSTWTVNGFLGVGYSGTGTLNIEDGGSVSSDSCFVAADPGSEGHVNVAGGAWSVVGAPVIGEHSVGTLTISEGGTLTDSGTFIGRFPDGNGDALVTGAGSLWTTNGVMTIANGGTGTLTVQNGGQVTNTSYAMIGDSTGSEGTLNVSDGTFSSAELYVGFVGVGHLNIGAGGVVNSAEGSVGGFTSAAGSSATVVGAGARWICSGELNVGDGGGASLTIQNGGVVTSTVSKVGAFNGVSATAFVHGAGSSWTCTNLAVGYLTGAGSLRVENGGHVTCPNAGIGSTSGTGSATVTGTGSAWDLTGTLGLGFQGSGTLTLEQGGAITCLNVSLGFDSGASGAATITDPASNWQIGAAGIQMSESGAAGTLNINGGTVTVGGNITDGGAGVSTLTLDGGTLDMTNHAIGGATPIDNLAFRSGILRNVTGINNGAGLAKTGPGTLILNTANTYSGTTTVNAGTLQVTNTTGSATGPGAVTVAAGAFLIGTGRIGGAVTNRGSVAPGLSAGSLRMTSTYTQIASASLNIEIGGTTSGTQYDRLAVTGAASLNGTLNVTLINGFQPAIGHTFDVLTAGSTSGAFSTVNLPPLNSGSWNIEYFPTIVRLSVTGCPADFNGDGFLDFFDADAYVACFEGIDCPPGKDADFNRDGFIDFFDLDEFVGAFEAGC